jgi:5,10-methenyltetrahydrofolate synthetase
MQAHQSETDDEKKKDKMRLREVLLSARRALAPAERMAATAAIENGVMRWWETHRPSSLGVYWPIRSEPDLRPLYAMLLARGVELALPTVDDDRQPLRFLAWRQGDTLNEDRFGVAVPAQGNVILPAALLIPCVGFNTSRIRLGYGGGFYDRTLAQTPRPVTLGIAYECGAAQFDGEAHDIALDAVLTESRLIGI